jgi:hypothetical protein
LTITTDAQSQIQSFQFERFLAGHTFGSAPGDFPLAGNAAGGPGGIFGVTVDPSAPATPDHFVIRYHVLGPQTDYEEGVDGTRVASGLLVRYFLQGTLESASIDAQAAGVLAPDNMPTATGTQGP